MTGEGLEPSTNGLTYRIGFRRPSVGRRPAEVDSLDSLIAVAGVPRRVSEAGTGAPPDPCLLITQSRAFSDRHACRRRLSLWWRGLSGRPSILRHPLVAVRFLPARGSQGSPFLKSVALPTELPGQPHLD